MPHATSQNSRGHSDVQRVSYKHNVSRRWSGCHDSCPIGAPHGWLCKRDVESECGPKITEMKMGRVGRWSRGADGLQSTLDQGFYPTGRSAALDTSSRASPQRIAQADRQLLASSIPGEGSWLLVPWQHRVQSNPVALPAASWARAPESPLSICSATSASARSPEEPCWTQHQHLRRAPAWMLLPHVGYSLWTLCCSIWAIAVVASRNAAAVAATTAAAVYVAAATMEGRPKVTTRGLHQARPTGITPLGRPCIWPVGVPQQGTPLVGGQ